MLPKPCLSPRTRRPLVSQQPCLHALGVEAPQWVDQANGPVTITIGSITLTLKNRHNQQSVESAWVPVLLKNAKQCTDGLQQLLTSTLEHVYRKLAQPRALPRFHGIQGGRHFSRGERLRRSRRQCLQHLRVHLGLLSPPKQCLHSPIQCPQRGHRVANVRAHERPKLLCGSHIATEPLQVPHKRALGTTHILAVLSPQVRDDVVSASLLHRVLQSVFRRLTHR